MHGSKSMRTVADPFKSLGRFFTLQRSLASGSDWSAFQAAELQRANIRDYANTFTLNPGSCPTSIVSMTPVKTAWDDGSYARSNQFLNNHFYRFDHVGGPVRISLVYDKPSSNPGDLDLYVYKAGYAYGFSTDMAASSNSENDRSTKDPTKGVEAINSSLPAGSYLINVMAYTGVSAAAQTNYYLSVNGQIVCPTQW